MAYFEKPSIKALLSSTNVGTHLTVSGWIRTRRDSKEVTFLEINDGSCLANLQVLLDNSDQILELKKSLNTGASIEVEGTLVESPAKGQAVELKASSLKVLGECDAEKYPLQKKRHTNEYLRTIGHLRPRTNTFGSVFRVRSAAALAVHDFFKKHGFVYLHTPIISASDCEGAGNMFRVTTLDLENPPRVRLEGGKIGGVDTTKDFFGKDAFLTVSGQLEGEIFASALGKIYTFGPTFRAENSNTARHLAEFWMIEPEMAFCNLQENMEIAESFVRDVIGSVLNTCAEDLAFFDKWVEQGIVKSLTEVAEAKFSRVTYTDAVKILTDSKKGFEFPVTWGMDLQTEHERFLAEEYFKGPVFVTNYPKEIKSFYMRLDEDGRTVSAMDLLVPRLGEIIGGSQREERADVLRKKIDSFGLKPEDYWWYLELRDYGSVPHSGFGLGFERLVMYLTGMQNIRDVVPFARTPGNADF
jgi:asparaginyl-tRNA synthetase